MTNLLEFVFGKDLFLPAGRPREQLFTFRGQAAAFKFRLAIHGRAENGKHR